MTPLDHVEDDGLAHVEHQHLAGRRTAAACSMSWHASGIR